MPIIQSEVSVAAGATNDNVFQGSQFEFLPFDAQVDFAVNGSAAGLVVDVYSGQDVLAESVAVNALNRTPIIPDDYVLTDIAAAGDRLKMRVRNPTGGALTAFFGARITRLV